MKIGVLGSGQLSRMLAQASSKLQGLEVIVLADHKRDAVEGLGVQIRDADLTSVEKIKTTVAEVDLLTFENEFLDLSLFFELQAHSEIKFFPSLEAIQTLQNKVSQKLLMQKLNVPTAKWELHAGRDLGAELGPHVLKWARQGYDGKGVFFVTDDAKPEKFLKEAQLRGIEVYGESLIDFAMEGAILAARNWSGETQFYPVVETRQIEGICHDVSGGSMELQRFKKPLQEMATKILEDLNYVGILALEFFVNKAGEVLINELAPRVHNSGHYTQLACDVSQFEMHLRCGMDLPLDPPQFRSHYYGMWNLIPFGKVNRQYLVDELPPLEKEFDLQWYYKKEIRQGRKMGHINFLANTPSELQAKRQYLKEWEREWYEQFQK